MTAPTNRPPVPPAVPQQITDIIEFADQLMQVKAANTEIQNRVDILTNLIKQFGVKEGFDFAKKFLDEITDLKIKATNELDDFTEKYKSFAQLARQEKNEADKALADSFNGFLRAQQLTIGLFNKQLGQTEESSSEYTKRIIESLKKGEDVIAEIATETAKRNFSQAEAAKISQETLKRLSEEHIRAEKTVGQFKQALTDAGFNIALTAAENAKLTSEIVKQVSEENRLIGTKEKLTEALIRQAAEQLKSNMLRQDAALIALRLADNEEKLAEASFRLSKHQSDLVDKFLGSSKNSTLFSDSIVVLTRQLLNATADVEKFGNTTKGFFSDGLKGTLQGAGVFIKSFADNVSNTLSKSVFNIESSANRLGNFLKTNLIDSTFKFDETLAQVNKTTGGFGKEFERVAVTSSGMFSTKAIGDLAKYGITLSEYGVVYSSLSKSIGNFNNMLDEERKLLADNAAKLENLGFSSESYAKLTNILMGSLNKGGAEVTKTLNNIANSALGLKISVQTYTTELEAMFNKLIGYGKEATGVFKDLQVLSQATNKVVSAQDLLTFAQTFQKFDTGSEALSRLNMMLGGTLDMAKLMRTGADNPANIIYEIRNAAMLSGKDIDSMNYYLKSFLAEPFGGDVAKVMAILKMDMEKVNELANANNASEKEKEERIQKSKAAMDKFNAAMENLRISLTPIIEKITSIATTIAEWSNSSPWAPFLVFSGILLGSFAASVAWAAFSIRMGIGGSIKEATAEASRLRAEFGGLNSTLTTTSGQLSTIAGQMAGIRGAGTIGAPMVLNGTAGQPVGALGAMAAKQSSAAGAPTPVLGGPMAPQPGPQAPTPGGGGAGQSGFAAGAKSMGLNLAGFAIGTLLVAGVQAGISKYYEKDIKKAAEDRDEQRRRKRKLKKDAGGAISVADTNEFIGAEEEPVNDAVIDLKQMPTNFLKKSAGSGIQIGSIKQPLNNEDFVQTPIATYGPSNANAREIIATKGGGLLDKLFVDTMTPKFQQLVQQFNSVTNSGVAALVNNITSPESILYKPFQVITTLTGQVNKDTEKFVEIQKQKTETSFAKSKELTATASKATSETIKMFSDRQTSTVMPEIKNNLQVELMIPELGGRLQTLVGKQATKIAKEEVENGMNMLVNRLPA